MHATLSIFFITLFRTPTAPTDSSQNKSKRKFIQPKPQPPSHPRRQPPTAAHRDAPNNPIPPPPLLLPHKDKDAAPPAPRAPRAPSDAHALVHEGRLDVAHVGGVHKVELLLGDTRKFELGTAIPYIHTHINMHNAALALGLGSCVATSMPKSVSGSKRADLKLRLCRVGDCAAEAASTCFVFFA